ncbi:hypothetical protein [Flavobacterium sp.]|uniref:hypothetical protein n=1 Tax=Flavobacterium sp. TaxID=239 RepID=UPI00286AD3CE|nr:hypothetical protein [Flavobacterium sp.]
MKLPLFLFLLVLISCKTYTISPDSFKRQYLGSESNKMRQVEINNPLLIGKTKYLLNNVKVLEVTDKNGNIVAMKNEPSVEMRVTHKNGQKYHYYFQMVLLDRDTLKGGRSVFLNLTRSIPFDSIVKIEIQNNKKGLNYYENAPDALLAETDPKASKILVNSYDAIANIGEVLKNASFSLDSVDVSVSKLRNIDYATCLFKKSNTLISIIYIKEKDALQMIKTREYNQVSGKGWCINDFYLENNKVFLEERWILFDGKLINKNPERYEALKFNKSLNADFLKKFTSEIYDRIEHTP